jgi:hypothetical protein
MSKPKVYANRIDFYLGLLPKDIEEFRRTSRPHIQRMKQRARWAAHKARKAAA